MNVCLVGVGGDENLEAGEHLLCKFQRNLMSSFGCQLFVGVEGLGEMIEHSAVGLSIWKDGVVFAILIVVLLVKPTGILGRPQTEKV